MDLSLLRKNLRGFLGVENVAPAITASLPTASLGGIPPEMSFTRPAVVSSAAPSASVALVAASPAVRPVRTVATPGLHDTFKLYEEQIKIDFDLESKLALAATPEAHRQIRAAFAQFRASKIKGQTLASIGRTSFPLKASMSAPRAATPPSGVDDQGVPVKTTTDDPENAPGLDKIISQLLDLLTELKKLVATAPADDEEATAALGHFAAGRKLTASRALMELTKNMTQRKRLSPEARIARGFSAEAGVAAIQAVLRPGPRTAPAAQTAPAVATSAAVRPLSPSAKVARGFNNDPAVAALNGFLHRAPSATPSAPSVPPAAPPVAASSSGYRDRVQAIQAESKSLEMQMRKSGVYDAKSLARQAQLKTELHGLIKANRK